MASLTSFIGKLFRTGAAAPPDATKLDGTNAAALTHSLSALSPDERGFVAPLRRTEMDFGEDQRLGTALGLSAGSDWREGLLVRAAIRQFRNVNFLSR
jgi:hypothetical protein